MKRPLIIFDLDGVLFDSIGVMKDFTRAQFVDIPQDALDELFTGNIHEAIKNSVWQRKEESEEAIQKRTEDYVATKLLVPMYPGMKELVKNLAASHTLAINTYARPARSLPLLERENIAQYFDFIGTFDPNGVRQTKIEKFKMIAEKYTADMNDMLFITDSLGDVLEIATLGVPTIAVTWGVHNRNFFEREPHTHLVAIVDTTEKLAQTIHSYK